MLAPSYSVFASEEDDIYIELRNYADHIDVNGCYFTFDLPVNGATASYKDITVIISAKGRVTNYNYPDQMLSLSARYAHIQLQSPFDASFSWDPINMGVSIETGALI